MLEERSQNILSGQQSQSELIFISAQQYMLVSARQYVLIFDNFSVRKNDFEAYTVSNENAKILLHFPVVSFGAHIAKS